MLKMAGISLILTASVLYGYMLRMRLHEHLDQLIGMKEFLLMLSGEISYARAPLEEAFLHIAEQGREPYVSLLKRVRERMIAGGEFSLKEIWMQELAQQKDQFLLTEDEYRILKNSSDHFGYLDWEMQIKNIAVYEQQVEVKIIQAQNELAAKQKIYQYLSVMGGLFLIILFI